MRAIKNIIGAIFISIAALIFWVFILPGYEMQAYLKSSVEMRSVALDTKTKLIEKVIELNKNYQDKFNELKRLSLVIPAEKNIAEIITSVEAMSSQSGILLSGLVLGVSQNAGTTKPQGVVGIEISYSGSYESILTFFDNIEKSIRLIDTDSMSLAVDDNKSTALNMVLSGNIRTSAYFVKNNTSETSVVKTQSNANE